MNLKRLTGLCLPVFVGIFACTESKDVVEEIIDETPDLEYELPTIAVDSIDSYVRGDYSISVAFSDYQSDILTLENIVLNHEGKQISEGVINDETSKITFEIDSKTIKDGITNLEVKATFEALEGLSETEASLNFDIEVDNYFPALYVGNGYSDRNYDNNYSRRTEYSLDFFITDQNNNQISEIYNSAEIEGDSVMIEIPEDFEGQTYNIVRVEHYIDEIYGDTSEEPYNNNNKRNNNSITIETKHTNGESNEFKFRDPLVEKSITLAISKDIEDYYVSGYYQSGADTRSESSDDNYNYITYEKVKVPISYRNMFMDNVTVFSGEKYATVLLSFMEDGDTMKIEQNSLTDEYVEFRFNEIDQEYFHMYTFGIKGDQEGFLSSMETFGYEDDEKFYKVRKPLNSDTEIEYLIIATKYFDGGNTTVRTSGRETPINNYRQYITKDNFTTVNTSDKIGLKSDLVLDNQTRRITLSNNTGDNKDEVISEIRLYSQQDIEMGRSFNFDISSLNNSILNELLSSSSHDVSYSVSQYDAASNSHLIDGSFSINWSDVPTPARVQRTTEHYINHQRVLQ
ncbi:hypothetical protein [Flammeovirga agarivorans]|uniref:Uncharacterized protein n=1 Tax=Flammeovirga agarivorans TaxID=2726742 RepID=A0A7X8XXX9_9BACT|nr:hypothetical protein [Flammeovirga agarivorans]NLR93694.1 hypothetical protein [Flammeovirga agarivorans]